MQGPDVESETVGIPPPARKMRVREAEGFVRVYGDMGRLIVWEAHGLFKDE